MKKILLGLCVILGLINMIGCSSDEKYPMPVSYTHLDVYKRQHKYFLHNFLNIHRGGEIEPCELINLFPVMIV